MIKAGIVGVLGKMGKEVARAVLNDDETELVMAVDITGEGIDAGFAAAGKDCGVTVETDIEKAILSKKPDVVIDFTQPNGIFEHVKTYINMGIKSVIGTTGLKSEEIKIIKKMTEEKNTACFIAPNFTTGAVLLMMFAKQAAKYFKNAEIIELHHNQKKDAPSGTAIKTAELMAESNDDFTIGNINETELLQGARGANTDSNIHIHSVRIPGYIASEEIIFGSQGQILKLEHHSVDRTCYMAGVLMAVKYVNDNNGFTYGLENIM